MLAQAVAVRRWMTRPEQSPSTRHETASRSSYYEARCSPTLPITTGTSDSTASDARMNRSAR